MLITDESVAREGVGRGQRERDRDDRVEDHVLQGVDIARVPARVCEDLRVVGESEIPRPQGQAGGDLRVCLEAHVHKPVNWQSKEEQIEAEDDGTAAHYAALRSSSTVLAGGIPAATVSAGSSTAVRRPRSASALVMTV